MYETMHCLLQAASLQLSCDELHVVPWLACTTRLCWQILIIRRLNGRMWVELEKSIPTTGPAFFAISVLQHIGYDILLTGSKSSGGGLKTERTKGIMEEMAFRVSFHSPQGKVLSNSLKAIGKRTCEK